MASPVLLGLQLLLALCGLEMEINFIFCGKEQPAKPPREVAGEGIVLQCWVPERLSASAQVQKYLWVMGGCWDRWGTRGWERIQGSAFTQCTPKTSQEVFIMFYFPEEERGCDGGHGRGQADGVGMGNTSDHALPPLGVSVRGRGCLIYQAGVQPLWK